MRLPSDVVWELTLRRFVALMERHDEALRAADRRAGEVVSMLYNVNRDQKKDARGSTWLDFFPEWKEPEPEQTDDQMLAAMHMWVKATRNMEA